MIHQPASLEQLRQTLADACARGEKLPAFDLTKLNRVLEHTAEDMTVTVEAGITLAALQTHLAGRGQWLPIDPPAPDAASIADVLNANASGPRRFGHGTIREHLLGIQVALADGRLIKSDRKSTRLNSSH